MAKPGACIHRGFRVAVFGLSQGGPPSVLGQGRSPPPARILSQGGPTSLVFGLSQGDPHSSQEGPPLTTTLVLGLSHGPLLPLVFYRLSQGTPLEILDTRLLFKETITIRPNNSTKYSCDDVNIPGSRELALTIINNFIEWITQ